MTEQAQKQLEELPQKPRRQIEQRIIELGKNPFPSNMKALKGIEFEGLYRIRSGDYRIIYQVQRQKLIVVVVKIGNRKDVYE